jgi:two-component system, chemotaxis family, chemotaxis protein CheY
VVITALIVDDERDIRAMIRMVVEVANHGLSVAGEAADGDEALAMWRSDPPVVMILDNRMPGLTGLEVAEQILAEKPDQSIILFSAYLDDETVSRAERIGIHRCLDKTQIDQLPGELWALAPSA